LMIFQGQRFSPSSSSGKHMWKIRLQEKISI